MAETTFQNHVEKSNDEDESDVEFQVLTKVTVAEAIIDTLLIVEVTRRTGNTVFTMA